MQSKVIWIINQYASTPETGMGGRHYHLARELTKQGHRVTLVAAGYTHILRNPPKFQQPYMVQRLEGFDFVWLGVPSYPDAHSKKRILNWFSFAWKLRRLIEIIDEKPDAILCSSPSLVSFLGAERLAKHFNARLVFEVRDIWPLTFIELGGFSVKNPFILLLQWIEDRAYQKSDRVVSNLKNCVDHMVMRGMDRGKFVWIPNGFSMDEVNRAHDLSATILTQLPVGKFIVGYTGAIGVANALETVIAAAKQLQDIPEINFVLVGDGREKSKLVALVEKLGLSNVTFIESIPKNQVQSMLSQFDVCFIGLKKDPLFKFGVSPNKLFDYLYAEKPILYAIDSGNYVPISEASAGLQIPAEDPMSMVKAVLELYQMTKEDRKKMGVNGRFYALEHHEYGALAIKLADVLVGGNV